MKQVTKLARLGIIIMSVMALGTGSVNAGSAALMRKSSGTLTITLQAGDYTLHRESDGQTHIRMEQD